MSQVNIENIDISQTLPVIACDYDGLKNWALAYVSRYKDLVITDDQVKEIKKDMAEINKAKQRIDRARIEAVKAVSAPIKAFEAKIKEICGIFDDAYNSLGAQVREFEYAEREQKRLHIQALIDKDIQTVLLEYPEFEGKLDVEILDKWLNKSYPEKDIKEGIYQSISGQINAEQKRISVEKAQAERRMAIENFVKSMSDKYKVLIPVSHFMTPNNINLENDFAAIMEDIEEEAKIMAEAAKRDSHESTPERPDAAPATEPENDLLMFRFTATFTPEQEAQVKEILNRNNFLKIKRQLDSIGIHTIVEQGNA